MIISLIFAVACHLCFPDCVMVRMCNGLAIKRLQVCPASNVSGVTLGYVRLLKSELVGIVETAHGCALSDVRAVNTSS